MAEPMQVEVVCADRVVWSGKSTNIIAKTVEGDIGILPGHEPVLAVLVPGAVEIFSDDGPREIVAVDGGFISVSQGRVSILSEYARMASEVSLSQAEKELAEASGCSTPVTALTRTSSTSFGQPRSFARPKRPSKHPGLPARERAESCWLVGDRQDPPPSQSVCTPPGSAGCPAAMAGQIRRDLQCSLRLRTTIPGSGWALGIARYNDEILEWYRFFSFTLRPRKAFLRRELRVVDYRQPDPVEAVSLYADQRVVRIEVHEPPDQEEWDLAMSPGSLTVLLSWLEAAPRPVALLIAFARASVSSRTVVGLARELLFGRAASKAAGCRDGVQRRMNSSASGAPSGGPCRRLPSVDRV